MNTLQHHPGRTPAERRAVIAREDQPVKAPTAGHLLTGLPETLRAKLRHRALVTVARSHPAEYLAALAAETSDIRSRWPR